MTRKIDNSNHGKRYTDEQINAFTDLAQVVGVGRARRELGYPTHTTAAMWLHKLGIEAPEIDVMAEARKFSKMYQAEDLIRMIDDGIDLIESMFGDIDTADDAKKLADAIKNLVNTRLLLEGKANSITEKRETTQADLEIAELLRAEQAKQNPRVSQTPS